MALVKKIPVSFQAEDLEFTVTLAHYDKYIDEMAAGRKTASNVAKNFLLNTVKKEQVTKLKELFETVPGTAMHLVGAVIEEFQPDLDVSIKK